MTALRALVLAICAGTLAHTAYAGDAAALRVLGFSPDGTVFAFEQYTMLYEDDAAFSEYVLVDTKTDRFIPGTPIKVLVRGDDGLDEAKARADAEKRATPLLKRHRVGEPGARADGKPSMALDEIGIYQMASEPLAKTQDASLPDGRELRLAVTERALGEAVCDGAGGRQPGKVAVTGVTLTLSIDGGAPMTLQADRRLPQSRRCVSAYGIADLYTHVAPDKTTTVAAMIELVDNNGYHAGPNRRFMAVTKRLPAK